jgi:hypothetical protein
MTSERFDIKVIDIVDKLNTKLCIDTDVAILSVTILDMQITVHLLIRNDFCTADIMLFNSDEHSYDNIEETISNNYFEFKQTVKGITL